MMSRYHDEVRSKSRYHDEGLSKRFCPAVMPLEAGSCKNKLCESTYRSRAGVGGQPEKISPPWPTLTLGDRRKG